MTNNFFFRPISMKKNFGTNQTILRKKNFTLKKKNISMKNFHSHLSSYTEKSFRNLIKFNRNQIVFTIFRLIWNQTDTVRLVPNQSENSKYNLISV